MLTAANRYHHRMAETAPFRTEARALVQIAGPVVVAEIGWMSMGLVDTVMVGPLGPEAIAATGLGTGVFTAIAVFGMGLMLGLDTLVSQAFGATRLDECKRLLVQGVWLAALVTPFVLALTGVALASMGHWGLNETIRPLAEPYLQVVALSTVPLLMYAALRRFLLGVHQARPIMVALVSANLVNLVANYALIYGHWGLPALGVRGAAAATTLARCYMALALWAAVRRTVRTLDAPPAQRALDIPRLVALARLGLPAAVQVTLEVGAFTLATALAARLDAVSSAAHQIALNVASLAYMVPLGLCSAAAVRVGHAIGARDRPRAVRAGWTAIGLSGVLMLGVAVVMWLAPHVLVAPFSRDPQVVLVGSMLLVIAAAFQLFDAVQTVAIGALRGLGDTVAPMMVGLVGHWLIGLPIGYVLCFRRDWGVTGLWVGFLSGILVVSVVLLWVWIVQSQRLTATSADASPRGASSS